VAPTGGTLEKKTCSIKTEGVSVCVLTPCTYYLDQQFQTTGNSSRGNFSVLGGNETTDSRTQKVLKYCFLQI